MPRRGAHTNTKKSSHTIREQRATYRTVSSRSEFKLVTRRQINAVARRIAEHFNPEKIILFGSYAYGKPTVDSDVDLLVVMESNEHRAWRATRILRGLLDVPFPMDVLVRTPREVLDRLSRDDYFLREIVQQGQVLYER